MPREHRASTGPSETSDLKVVVIDGTGLIGSEAVPVTSARRFSMLMIAEGTPDHPVTDQKHREAAAWLVPMIDAGFLHGGWIDMTEHRLSLVISALDLAEAQQRLDGLPFAQDGSVSFTLTRVKALPIS
jgi:hypothetical protein